MSIQNENLRIKFSYTAPLCLNTSLSSFDLLAQEVIHTYASLQRAVISKDQSLVCTDHKDPEARTAYSYPLGKRHEVKDP